MITVETPDAVPPVGILRVILRYYIFLANIKIIAHDLVWCNVLRLATYVIFRGELRRDFLFRNVQLNSPTI